MFKIIEKLKFFWKKMGLIEKEKINIKIAAATMNHFLFKKIIYKKKIKCFFVQDCYRPNDISGLEEKNKLYKHKQFQVYLRPFKKKYIKLFFKSLKFIGIKKKNNIIRNIKDNWKNASIGSYGKGWEVNINFMEIAQITVFDRFLGIKLNKKILEITYGLDRIIFLIKKNYSYLSKKNEKNFCFYKEENKKKNLKIFNIYKKKTIYCIKNKNFYFAKENILKMINIFNENLSENFNCKFYINIFLTIFSKLNNYIVKNE